LIWGFARNSAEPLSSKAREFAMRNEIAIRETRLGDRWLLLWHPECLPRQLAEEKLDALAESEQSAIVAQHLGILRGRDHFTDLTIEAFRRLKRYEDEKRILVASSGRLLRYERIRDNLEVTVQPEAGHDVVDLARVADPLFGTFVPTFEDVRGITLHVPEPARVKLLVGGSPVPAGEVVRAEGRSGGGPSIGVRWFERDVTDYARAWTG
jgi:hypothetical protein